MSERCCHSIPELGADYPGHYCETCIRVHGHGCQTCDMVHGEIERQRRYERWARAGRPDVPRKNGWMQIEGHWDPDVDHADRLAAGKE